MPPKPLPSPALSARPAGAMSRRLALFTALSSGAALAQPKPEAAPKLLWDSRFAQPAGGELAFADLKGRWLLINFWATWCAPCIKELPDLNLFHQAQAARGRQAWVVVGLAVDGPTPVRQFLQRFTPPLAFPIGLAGLNGAELGRSFGNSGGQLPFTVAINPQGQIVWRHRGVSTLAELNALAQRLE